MSSSLEDFSKLNAELFADEHHYQSMKLLLKRKSHNKLIAPAPTDEQLAVLFKHAIRAPDHALLRPWRYRVFKGESLDELGEKFSIAAQFDNPQITQEKLDKTRAKPHRAPMVVVASVVIQSHPKVPEIEQVLSGGASVQNLLQAAHLLGIGAMWRTGNLAFSNKLAELLALEQNEKIIGFIYLGQEEGEKRKVRWPDLSEHVVIAE